MVRAMCGVQLKDSNIVKDFMLMMDLKETIDEIALANIVCRYGHVLRREDGHISRRSLDFEAEGHRKKGRPNRTWKKLVKEESSLGWFEK